MGQPMTLLDAPPIRFSRLKLIGKPFSPAHYHAAVDEQTASKHKGSALHSIILGGKRVTFYNEVTATGRSAPRNGSKWEAFQAANADALILSRSEYEDVNRMAEAVLACPHAMEMLTGIREQTLLYKWKGRDCRATPDCRAPGGEWLTELKSCVSSNPDRFQKQMLWLRYHGQLAWYRRAMLQLKLKPLAAYVVAVESSPPYPVTVMRLTDRALDQGERLCSSWMETLRGCEESNFWPPYAQSIVPLDVPDEPEIEFSDGGEPNTSEDLPAGW
jgi:hypothetical protein